MQHSLARRLRAARALGGYASRQALATEINMSRLSGKNLQLVEEGKRTLEPHEREAVAAACRIDVAFFDIDLEHLAAAPAPGPGTLAAAEDLARTLLRDALDALGGEEPSPP